MSTPLPAHRNPTNAAGILALLAGCGCGLVALVFGLLAVAELDRYNDLRRAGNPFAGLVANSWTYLAGTTAVAALAGFGLIVVGVALMAGRFRAA